MAPSLFLSWSSSGENDNGHHHDNETSGTPTRTKQRQRQRRKANANAALLSSEALPSPSQSLSPTPSSSHSTTSSLASSSNRMRQGGRHGHSSVDRPSSSISSIADSSVSGPGIRRNPRAHTASTPRSKKRVNIAKESHRNSNNGHGNGHTNTNTNSRNMNRSRLENHINRGGDSYSRSSQRSNDTLTTDISKNSRRSAKSASAALQSGRRPNSASHSVHSQLTTHSTKTAAHAKISRKSRLPSLLAFRKKKIPSPRPSSSNSKSRFKEDGDGDGDNSSSGDTGTSALSHKSKSALLTEFATLMNEFPTKDTLNTTLHIACLRHYSESLIVEQLIAKGPTAISMKNQSGDLPLHSAMRSTIDNGVDDRVFNALVKKYPIGIKLGNKEHCLPLHLICQSGGRNFYVVKKLVIEFPVGVMMKCDLKLPFDNMALSFMHRADQGGRPQTAEFANADSFASNAPPDPKSDVETCTGAFWSNLFFFAPANSFEANPISTSADPFTESSFSPLHLAVMNGAPPDVIEALIAANPRCLGLKTDQGRRPLDCALFLAAGKVNKKPHKDVLLDLSIRSPPSEDLEEERINEYIRNIDEDPVENIFAAIEIMKTFEANRRKSVHLVNATQMTSASLRDLNMNKNMSTSNGMHTIEEFDPKAPWKKLSNIIKFTGALKRQRSVLGVSVSNDLVKVVKPRGYLPPKNLNHVCVEIDLPVGFRRLRWAMLHSSSEFLVEEVLQSKLGYSQVEMSPWDKYDDLIGDTHGQTKDREELMIGAERSCKYLMPKSGMVGANMAYETHTIIGYNDYAFVMKKVTTNPDVPFGKSFECHVQTIFINLGYGNCKMISSVEAQFLGRPPMVAWKIKNAMYNGVTDFFVAKGEVICEHAVRERADAEAGEGAA